MAIKNLAALFKKNLFPLLLALIVAIISWRNYTPGTFLSGWDTLHPEFDFGLNFKRLIFGVWRQEQGLGAVAGHSHMADLPRVFILWIFHFLFPLNSLRYLYIFLCLFLGPLGVYFLVKRLFQNQKNANLAAFLAAAFYLFNPGAVQQFFVPFEMFPTQYAFLPWIILATFKFLKKPNRKNALFFILINLLSTPQAYAAHLWYAFFAVYSLSLFIYWLINRSPTNLRRILIIIGLTLIANSFWLLPNLYFIKTSAYIPRQARQNRLFSKEYQLRNRETGYLKDVALVRGFYFNWQAYDFQKERFTTLMPRWNQHLNNWATKSIGYSLFVISAVGLILALIKKKKFFVALTPFWLVPFIILMNHTPPFEQLFNFLIRFSVFDEALRFVFTKFSILLLFGYTVFLALAVAIFLGHLSRKVTRGITALGIVALVWYAWPMFQGRLISPEMRIKIPQEYFQFWQEMKTKEPGVVLPLPIYNFAGWQYYDFGYQGAGFIWFGLKQPILDRDFDRWHPANERAFKEFFFSIYSKNASYFAKNLAKFRIKYILWDQNVITPFLKNRNQVLFKEEIGQLLELLEKQGFIRLAFQKGSLTLYRVKNPSAIIETKNIKNIVAPSYYWTYWDQAYLDYNDYIADNQNYNVYYPWRNYLTRDDKFNPQLMPNLNSQEKITVFDKKTILKITDGQNGVYRSLPGLSHTLGYIIGFKSKYIGGLPLRICVKNFYSDLCVIYDELEKHQNLAWDYFLVPPLDEFSGYGISVDNISFGDYLSKNEIDKIAIIPVSFQDLVTIHRSRGRSSVSLYSKKHFPKIEVNLPFFYRIKTKRYDNTLILNQSYSPGWLAVYFQGWRPHLLGRHVLVDNWANGWQLPTSPTIYHLPSTIYILFWPQVLEFLGFFLLAATLVALRKQNT